jgi:hypothetical protein
MKIKAIAMTGVMSLAGLGLVGAGAHAVFTTSTSSAQTVSSGTLAVTLTGNGTLSNGATTLTFAPLAKLGSSFTTGDELTTMTNTGTIAAKEITATTAASGNSNLEADVYFCQVSSGEVIYNGPVAGAVALGTQSITGSIAVGSTDNNTINIYAGPTEPEACGAVTTVGAAAPSADAVNPAAASLTNVDEGGTLSISLTVGYSA